MIWPSLFVPKLCRFVAHKYLVLEKVLSHLDILHTVLRTGVQNTESSSRKVPEKVSFPTNWLHNTLQSLETRVQVNFTVLFAITDKPPSLVFDMPSHFVMLC